VLADVATEIDSAGCSSNAPRMAQRHPMMAVRLDVEAKGR